MEVDEGLSVGNLLADIGARANQEEPRSSIAPPGVQKTTPDVERGILKRDDGSGVIDSKRRQVNQDNPRGGGQKPICLCHSETLILLAGITHNVSHVCDVALSPTRAKGHVAERRAAAPRSPSRPEGRRCTLLAVMRSCGSISGP